ncbi:MAG: hypothetical protein JSW55_07870, partial [Chloroflexota bacterium]
YLVEEVFRRQPIDVRQFLLKTAILERLSGPLCAAVTGREDSQAVLRTLEQANLFVVPLDDSRQWYRYHRLFADLLRYRLQQEGLKTSELHLRAAGWYEANGQTAEAIGHSLAAQDWERAADMVDGICEHMLRQGQITTLLSWLDPLPELTLRARPDLCLNFGWALALSNQLEAAERHTKLVEPISEQDPALLGDVLALQAYIARARHDVPRTIELSQKTLALLPPDDANSRCVVGANLGVAYIYSGDLATAVQVWGEAVQDARRSGNSHVEILALSFLGQIQAAWGKLHQAAELQRQAIRLGKKEGAAPATVRAYVNLAALHYEWNELEPAREHLRRVLELSALGGDKHVQRDAFRLLALIGQAQGDPTAARDALRKARDLLQVDDVSVSAHLATASTHLRVALASGDLAMAMRWGQRIEELTSQTNTIRPDLLSNAGFFSPQPGLGQASLLIAQGQKEAAAARLTDCYQAAAEGGFGYSQVYACALQALAAEQADAAAEFLAAALTLAQPEGYVRVFVDAGRSLRPLLRRLATDKSLPGALAEKILVVASQEDAADSASPPSSLSSGAVLVEPLSERELEILRLLAQRHSNAEIAQALVVSPNTVKTHLRHIYEKLGVHDRWSAVARAHEIKILP